MLPVFLVFHTIVTVRLISKMYFLFLDQLANKFEMVREKSKHCGGVILWALWFEMRESSYVLVKKSSSEAR